MSLTEAWSMNAVLALMAVESLGGRHGVDEGGGESVGCRFQLMAQHACAVPLGSSSWTR